MKQAEQVGGRTVIGLGKLNNCSTQIFRYELLGALYQDAKGLCGVLQSLGYSLGGLLCVLRRREVGAEMANDGIRCSSLLSRDKAHLARDEAVAKTFDAKKSHQRSLT